MGVIQLADKVQRAIEQHVAEGHASSAAAFVEEAVLRLIDDARAEDEDIRAVVRAGIQDAETGRMTTVATDENAKQVHDRLMTRLQASLACKQASTACPGDVPPHWGG